MSGLVARDTLCGTRPRAWGIRFHSLQQFGEVFGRSGPLASWHRRKRGRTLDEIADFWWSNATEEERRAIGQRLELVASDLDLNGGNIARGREWTSVESFRRTGS